MVTPDEIGQIGILANLSEASRERLSKAAADITLVPGEWAVPEGGDRAFFAVLEGHIEAVKLVDGRERIVGSRGPGDVFGEVPLALGTVFPVGFRATESTRVMRVEPRDYHTVAAVEPDLAKAIGRLAANRIGGPAGLSSLAAEPLESRAIVFGHRLHPASAELRVFLHRNQITFTWVEPDAADAVELWGGPLPSQDDCPGGPHRRRPDRRAASASTGGAAARPRDGAARSRVRHRRRRRGPRRACRGRVRSVGGPADDRRRAGRSGRAGRRVVQDRELPRLPHGSIGRGSGEQGAAAGEEARSGDPRHPDDHAARSGEDAGASRRRRRPQRAHDHPRLRRHLAAPAGRGVRPAPREGRLRTAPRRARRRARTAWTCTSSAAATRPGRRRCTSRATRAT